MGLSTLVENPSVAEMNMYDEDFMSVAKGWTKSLDQEPAKASALRVPSTYSASLMMKLESMSAAESPITILLIASNYYKTCSIRKILSHQLLSP